MYGTSWQLCILLFFLYSRTLAKQFGGKGACPIGFVYQDGSLRGMGLEPEFDVYDISQCEGFSNNEPASKAFMYSKNEGKCKLLAHPNIDGAVIKDYVFCQKLGIIT